MLPPVGATQLAPFSRLWFATCHAVTSQCHLPPWRARFSRQPWQPPFSGVRHFPGAAFWNTLPRRQFRPIKVNEGGRLNLNRKIKREGWGAGAHPPKIAGTPCKPTASHLPHSNHVWCVEPAGYRVLCARWACARRHSWGEEGTHRGKMGGPVARSGIAKTYATTRHAPNACLPLELRRVLRVCLAAAASVPARGS